MGNWLCPVDATPEHKIMYHGSSARIDGDYLLPRPSAVVNGEKVVFATPDRTLALTFAGRQWSDDDLELGYVNGQLTLEERSAGRFEAVYNRVEAYIYTVDATSFHQDMRLGMYKHEWISDSAVKIQEREYVPNVASALYEAARHGKLSIVFHS